MTLNVFELSHWGKMKGKYEKMVVTHRVPKKISFL